MGQEAIDRGEYIPELTVDNSSKLLKSLNIADKCKENLAMQPDFVIETRKIEDVQTIIQTFQSIKDKEGNIIFQVRYAPHGCTINFCLQSFNIKKYGDTLYYNEHIFKLDELGLKSFSRDIGTGYHQQNGILIWQGSQAPKQNAKRETIDSRAFAPYILQSFGVDIPKYMKNKIEQ